MADRRRRVEDVCAENRLERNRRLTTPKAANIDQLFEDALGINEMSNCWSWSRMDPAKCRRKLDRFVELKGAIAHRGQSEQSVTKRDIVEYVDLVRDLDKTGGKVKGHVRRLTGGAVVDMREASGPRGLSRFSGCNHHHWAVPLGTL